MELSKSLAVPDTDICNYVTRVVSVVFSSWSLAIPNRNTDYLSDSALEAC